jgi:hypothetical protein
MRALRSSGFLAFVAVLSAWSTGCSSSAPEKAAAPPATAAARPAAAALSTTMPSEPPATLLVAKDLPLLPAPGLARAVRPPATVRAVYEFAARRPDVLKYVPCFCGCEQSGHVGNDDCFVSRRDAAGKVSEWEPHGLVCEVCIDVAQMAMQMFNVGASLPTIREAVEKKFAGSHGDFHTPTPQPPRKTGTHD